MWKIVLICLCIVILAQSKCLNNSEIKYEISQPADILHYYSTCSTFTKRTCCSIKNLQTLVKKVKKATQSIGISSNCKHTLSEMLCLTCDGDWGEGLYEGVCGSYCLNLYNNCQNDLFIIDSANGKIRACKQQDLFCWKLKDITKHYKLNQNQAKGQTQICELFNIRGVDHFGKCWSGQISSQMKGKGSKKLDYTRSKKQKVRKVNWWNKYTKQIIYLFVIIFLGGALLYKFCKPTRPRYYRLN